MRHALTAAVADAVAEHIFDAIQVRAVGEGATWRTVQGEVKAGAEEQTFAGFRAETVVGAETVHLLASDFPDGLPQAGWWVRELTGPNAGRVMRLSEPARDAGRSARFVMAPLRPNQETVPS